MVVEDVCVGRGDFVSVCVLEDDLVIEGVFVEDGVGAMPITRTLSTSRREL